jgi:superfamily II DNA or RNA helicase
VQTLARRRPWEFDLGIIDEAHILFKVHKELIKKWNKIPFIGLSATPFTKGLGNIYETLIRPISIDDLIKQKYLVDAEIYGPSQPDLKGCKSSENDFNQKDAADRSDKPKLIASIVETWLKLADNRQTICFATNVMHSKHIVEKFQRQGVEAHHIDAYTDSDERREKISKFKEGNIKILSSVGVLTTGFDAPNAEVAILARPTKSLALHIQMVGRVLRPFEGKEMALILDHAGNFERNGLHTDPTPNYLDSHKKPIPKGLKERLPKPCPKCAFMKKTAKCPNCGHETKPVNTVHETDGELTKIQNKNNRTYTNQQKHDFYSGLLGYVKKKGYKQGWASHKYKEKFGVWPNHYKDAKPSEPNEEVKNWIKYLNIKASYNRKNRDNGEKSREARSSIGSAI